MVTRKSARRRWRKRAVIPEPEPVIQTRTRASYPSLPLGTTPSPPRVSVARGFPTQFVGGPEAFAIPSLLLGNWPTPRLAPLLRLRRDPGRRVRPRWLRCGRCRYDSHPLRHVLRLVIVIVDAHAHRLRRFPLHIRLRIHHKRPVHLVASELPCHHDLRRSG